MREAVHVHHTFAQTRLLVKPCAGPHEKRGLKKKASIGRKPTWLLLEWVQVEMRQRANLNKSAYVIVLRCENCSCS
ncbi:hypothetical protein LIA77_03002 [Sarocladium implicatum]|nr:hypothetical protein LIA77_03002 [Sarocladium implicatum]